MNLFEFMNTARVPFQEPKDDNSVMGIEDTRKTRLTLKRIHQLRKINDVKEIEQEKELTRLKTIYGAGSDDSDAGLGL